MTCHAALEIGTNRSQSAFRNSTPIIPSVGRSQDSRVTRVAAGGTSQEAPPARAHRTNNQPKRIGSGHSEQQASHYARLRVRRVIEYASTPDPARRLSKRASACRRFQTSPSKDGDPPRIFRALTNALIQRGRQYRGAAFVPAGQQLYTRSGAGTARASARSANHI